MFEILVAAGRIAAGEGRFNTNSEVIINTEVKSIPVTKKGVYFAFRDQGACISLLAIKVSPPLEHAREIYETDGTRKLKTSSRCLFNCPLNDQINLR